MVSAPMRRFRVRTDDQAWFVGPEGDGLLDFPTLFGRRAPLRLDIGSGHGEFISQIAASHPDEDCLGVDLNDLRITKTAHKSLRLSARNVRLFWDDAHRFVRCRLPSGCLHRAYVLFPDPWPRKKHRRRRLMNRSFLLDLAWAMEPGGIVLIGSDTHEYVFSALANITTLPGLFRIVSGCASSCPVEFDIPTRYPTVFERHKKEEGHRIAYLRLERTAQPAPPRLPFLRPTDPGA